MIKKATKIYIAGHRGMVGSAVWRALESKGYSNLIGKSSSELDLRNQNDVNDFQVIPGDGTAGGRADSGITHAKTEKVGTGQFKVWFNRTKGANTYVSDFTIKGI